MKPFHPVLHILVFRREGDDGEGIAGLGQGGGIVAHVRVQGIVVLLDVAAGAAPAAGAVDVELEDALPDGGDGPVAVGPDVLVPDHGAAAVGRSALELVERVAEALLAGEADGGDRGYGEAEQLHGRRVTKCSRFIPTMSRASHSPDNAWL